MTTPPQDALIRIVDDESDVCEALSLMLDIEGARRSIAAPSIFLWKTIPECRAASFWTFGCPT